MHGPAGEPRVLEYRSPRTSRAAGDPLLGGMRAWRLRAAWGLLMLLFMVFAGAAAMQRGVPAPVRLAAAACTLMALAWTALSVVLCLVWMTRYAAANNGAGYAARHLALAILLSPLLLLGVFAVTRLVEADIERRMGDEEWGNEE